MKLETRRHGTLSFGRAVARASLVQARACRSSFLVLVWLLTSVGAYAEPDFFLIPPLEENSLTGVGRGRSQLAAVANAIVDVAYQQFAVIFVDREASITFQTTELHTETFRVEATATEVAEYFAHHQTTVRFFGGDISPVTLNLLRIQPYDGQQRTYAMLNPRDALSPSEAIGFLVRRGGEPEQPGLPRFRLSRIEQSDGMWYALVHIGLNELEQISAQRGNPGGQTR